MISTYLKFILHIYAPCCAVWLTRGQQNNTKTADMNEYFSWICSGIIIIIIACYFFFHSSKYYVSLNKESGKKDVNLFRIEFIWEGQRGASKLMNIII